MSFNDGFSSKGIATPPTPPASGNVLVYDGTNWIGQAVAAATGDITSVTAGTNLTGGGTSGDITVALKDDIDVASVTASNAFIQGDVKINGTASVAQLNTLNQTSLVIGDKYITILSGGVDHATLDKSGILWGSGSIDPTTNELGANAHVRFDGINDKLEIFPGLIVSGALTASSVISGTTANFNSVTASFKGNLDGTAATASYIATGSAIATFVSDVRQQISGSQYVSYSTGSGVISLPFTGSTLGTTPLILGQTTTVLQGLTQLTASNVNVSNNLSASIISASFITAGNYSFVNAAASSDPAVLDDYREGTWTPILTCAGATFTTGSILENVGKYTKIGNLVMINGNVSITGKAGLGAGSTEQVFVSGLPFTSSNSISCSAYVGYYQGFNTNFPTLGSLGPSQTRISFFAAKNAASAENIRYTDLNPAVGAPTKIIFNLMYYVV